MRRARGSKQAQPRLETPLLDELRVHYNTLAQEWATVNDKEFSEGEQKLRQIWPYSAILLTPSNRLLFMDDAARAQFVKAAQAAEANLGNSLNAAYDQLNALNDELLGEAELEYEDLEEDEEERRERVKQEEEEDAEEDEEEEEDDEEDEEEEEEPQPQVRGRSRMNLF